MSDCFKCGISDKKTNLVTAVSKEGIVKVCAKCALTEGMPIIHKKDFSPEKSNDEFIAETHEKGKTVYNRLSKIAGLSMDKGRLAREREEMLKTQNQELRKLVENPEKKIILQKRTDLADNFHWLIMRARRAKKITQRDFANAIGESENSVKAAEEGNIALSDDKLVDKIENYLNIRLRREPTRASVSAPSLNKGGNFSFDPLAARNVTIAEVRAMSFEKKREAGFAAGARKPREIRKEFPEESNEKDLTKEKNENRFFEDEESSRFY